LHLWQPGTDLRAWLFTILHNQYVNHIRRAVREGSAVGLSESEPLLSRAPQQGKRLELRDLERAIAKLPKVVLDVPVGTIRSRLSRGREALRRLTGAAPDEDAGGRLGESKAVSRVRRYSGGAAVRSKIAVDRRARTGRVAKTLKALPQSYLEPSLG
jgi:RNA polymerase sigma-70 factor (ECF subfamily)